MRGHHERQGHRRGQEGVRGDRLDGSLWVSLGRLMTQPKRYPGINADPCGSYGGGVSDVPTSSTPFQKTTLHTLQKRAFP